MKLLLLHQNITILFCACMDVTTQLELCLHKHTQILHVANAALEWVATYVHS